MISVIVPFLNEEKRLPSTLSDMECFMRKHPDVVGEIILVDDGSTDATVEGAMRFMSRLPLRIERFPVNRGKWAALHHGMSVARYDALLLLDADGSASIWQLERIRGLRWVLRQRRVVFGSRFMEGASIEGKSLLRSVVSQGYRWYGLFWYWFATGRCDVSDLQCPMKLVYKSLMDVEKLCVERFAGDVELACIVGGEVMNVPVEFMHKAGSRVRLSSVVEMGMETVRVAFRMRRFLKERGE